MRRFKFWASLLLIVAVCLAGIWAVWNYDLRWRPKTITRHQAEIAKLLQSSGWAAPDLPGPKLYVISYRTCPECVRFRAQVVPKLISKDVDVRIVEIARRDENGVSRSTPAERATVAQIWLGHDWKLMQAWEATRAEAWTAPGLPPADGDMARTAVIESGRSLVDQLTPLLKDNGVRFAYPTLIWWNAKGEMRGCACDRRETYRFVRRELGA